MLQKAFNAHRHELYTLYKNENTKKKSRWAKPFWDKPLFKLYTAQ